MVSYILTLLVCKSIRLMQTNKMAPIDRAAVLLAPKQLHHPQLQGSPEGGVVYPPLQRGQTCPPGHLQPPMSQECQKDHHGQQPPEPRPVHPAIIQKAKSVQLHQSWDQETEKQLLSQGHETITVPNGANKLLGPNIKYILVCSALFFVYYMIPYVLFPSFDVLAIILQCRQ